MSPLVSSIPGDSCTQVINKQDCIELFNGRRYFQAGIYTGRGNFSHFGKFMGLVGEHFDNLPFEQAPVLAKVQQLRQEFTQVSKPIGQRKALQLMVAEDLAYVEGALQDPTVIAAIESERDIEGQLHKCLDDGIQELREIGLDLPKSPNLYVVDRLLHPYDANGSSAMTADEENKRREGIEPGIYFVRSGLRPFYSKQILLHELIHAAIDVISPGLSGRGLEEGIAEIMGALYLTSKILSPAIARNIFIYNRLAYKTPQYWQLYTEYTRQAALLYHRFGLDGIVHLLKGGRKLIKEVEHHCLTMNLERIELPSGRHDAGLTNLVDAVTAAFVPSLVVSPLAKYLLPYARSGQAIETILTEANVNKQSGRKALLELQDRVIIAIFRDDVTTWTEYCTAVPAEAVRYEIKS